MKYPEEDFANELHAELTRRFASSAPVTSVAIEGAGVHWHCTAQRGVSRCSIACFYRRGPEYYSCFERDSQKIASARIPSRDHTIAAVADWLDGHDLSLLYERYPFIDHTKRALTRLRDEVLTAAPELTRSAHCELEHQVADIYYLRFIRNARSCQISFYGKNEFPDAKFSWDDCQLFEFQPDHSGRLAAILNRWLCDDAMPSAMRAEFPSLDIGELADFYEKGKPVEGEFVKSWNWMEQFYDDTDCPFAAKVKDLIRTMRTNGYDHTLRAGQSLWSLILSRSRRHGLRDEQPCIQFWFRDDVMDVFDRITKTANENKIMNSEITLTPEINALLQQLQATPID